jgi:hypothetical protein
MVKMEYKMRFMSQRRRVPLQTHLLGLVGGLDSLDASLHIPIVCQNGL